MESQQIIEQPPNIQKEEVEIREEPIPPKIVDNLPVQTTHDTTEQTTIENSNDSINIYQKQDKLISDLMQASKGENNNDNKENMTNRTDKTTSISDINSSPFEDKPEDSNPVETKTKFSSHSKTVKSDRKPSNYSEESKSRDGEKVFDERGYIRMMTGHIPQMIDNNGEIVKETLYLQKPSPTILSEKEFVFVRIDEAEPVKGGLFFGPYIQYKITTKPLDWVVRRDYNDFFWLRSVLQKQHPGFLIPSIPKRQNKEKFGEDSVKKRMYIFERFLNTCMTNDDIKANTTLQEFLSIENEDEFKANKKAADKLPKLSKVEEMTASAGQITLDLRQEVATSAELIESYCIDTGSIFKEIRHLSKRLTAELSRVSGTLIELGDCYTSLYTTSNYFTKKIPVDMDFVNNTYLSLSKIIKDWGETVQEQVRSIKKNLVCFYKYESFENEYYKEMNQLRQKAEAEYFKQNKELNAKKEKLFQHGDLSKWDLDQVKVRGIPREELIASKPLAFDIMLTKETHQARHIKDMFGYMNSVTYTEMIKAFENRRKVYSNNFKEFALKQIEYMGQVRLNWSEFITDLQQS